MNVTGPGIYPDMDEREYHSDPCAESSLSVSGAKKILDCPARFKHELENRTEKKAFDFGHAAHAKVLGRGSPIAIIPSKLLAADGGVRSNEAKAWVAAARERGDVPLKPDEAAVVDAMAAKLIEHQVAARLLALGEAERSMFWRDEATKVMLRARTDWTTRWHDGRPVIVDYKTTARTADPSRWGYEARDFGYHQQDAWYREGSEILTGDKHLFLFIVQEKTAPYLVSVVELDDEAREVGAQRNRRAREIYLDCMTRDEWPGYPQVIHPVSLPYARYAPEGDAA